MVYRGGVQMDRLDTLVYKLIHRGKNDIEELAEVLGISTNYLYKMGLPEEHGSHSAIGLRRLVALMKAQGDNSILRHLCKRFGGVLVKLPRVARDKRDQIEIISDYQETTAGVIQLMIDYFNEPASHELRDRLIEKLYRITEKSVGIRKRVEHDGQFNLFN